MCTSGLGCVSQSQGEYLRVTEYLKVRVEVRVMVNPSGLRCVPQDQVGYLRTQGQGV